MDPPGTEPEVPQALLLQDWVEVECAVSEVRERLTGRAGLLSGIAGSAGRDGDELMARIGPTWAGGVLARKVVVQLGPCRERGSSYVFPLEWRAAGQPSLFPVLSGDLELGAVSHERCRVVLRASYLPPFGDLGRTLDRALLHRVAASTVRSFLQKLATSVEHEPPPAAGEGTPTTPT